jgi:hypothetical protein
MLESDFTNSLKKILLQDGFYFQKIRDGSTQGIPDCFISKVINNKKIGLFAEIKFCKRKNIPNLWREKGIFLPGGGKKIQLITMLQMNHYFNAQYIFGIQINNDIVINIIDPLNVFKLIENDIPIFLNSPVPKSNFPLALHSLLSSFS